MRKLILFALALSLPVFSQVVNNPPTGGGGSPSGSAGGDLTGTYPNPTIKLPFVADPTVAPTVALAGLGAGNVDNGDHCYGYTFGFANEVSIYAAQTYPSAYVTVTVADKTVDGQVQLTIPVSPDPRVTYRLVYRTKAGAACSDSAQFILVTIADNTTTNYIDNLPDSGVNLRYPVLDYASTAAAIVTGNNPNSKLPFSDSGAAISGAVNLTTDIPAALPLLLGVTPIGFTTLTPSSLLPSFAVSGLPSGATAGQTVYVTDGVSASDCTTGGGSSKVACVWNGSAWAGVGGPLFPATAVLVTSPTTMTAALAGTGAGNVDDGTHCYESSYATAFGESYISFTDNIVTVTDHTMDGSVALTVQPTADPRVTGIRIYRTKANIGCYTNLGGPNGFLVAVIAPSSTSYVDNLADTSLGAQAAWITGQWNTSDGMILGGEVAGTKHPVLQILDGALNIPAGVKIYIPDLANAKVLGVNQNGQLGGQLLSGTSGSIGGSLLTTACTTDTTSISGATVGMVAIANPTVDPGTGVIWDAFVSAANVVTIRVCTVAAITPTATTYNVRVLP